MAGARRGIEEIAAFRMGGEDPREAERLKLGPHPRDMDRDAVGFGFKGDAPHIGQQLAARQAFARLLGQSPQQHEFARVQAKPAILHPAIAVKQIERDIARLAEARDQCVAIGKQRVGRYRVHSNPPARME